MKINPLAKELFDKIEAVAVKEFEAVDTEGLRFMVERDTRGKMKTLTLRVGEAKKVTKKVSK